MVCEYAVIADCLSDRVKSAPRKGNFAVVLRPVCTPPYCDNMFNPYGTFVVGRPLSYLNGPHAHCAVKANMGGAAEVAAEPML